MGDYDDMDDMIWHYRNISATNLWYPFETWYQSFQNPNISWYSQIA
jgi:hypothetical protein